MDTTMWRGPLKPFVHPQYRLLVAAISLEMLAEGMWLIALVWQVIALGGGPAQLSVVALTWSLGVLVAALPGGATADRVPQHLLLICSTAIRTIVCFIVAGVALTVGGQVWHLAVAGLVLGLATGFYFPAYSAMLPSIVPADHLLAANGVEQMLRPLVLQAAGPAIAAAIVALSSPSGALLGVAVAELACLAALTRIKPVPLRAVREPGEIAGVRSAVSDIAEGFRYLRHTPWLLATLLYASLLVLVSMGPFEVLIPFAVRDHAGGGPSEHAWILAAFGIGGAVGSLLMASAHLPRRYLTWMNVIWAASCLPLVVVGVTSSVPVMALSMALMGAGFSAATVIWGTLLQRRVPPELLGRVSSLDFFVSLTFFPVSVAVAGPLSTWIGVAPTFLLAGLIPLPLAIIAVIWAKMPADELAHPLDVPAT